MTAQRNGKASWVFESDGSQEQTEAKTDQAFKMVVATMQRAICHLVNQEDTRRLVALQACTNRLYRQANDCLSQGKTMTIADDMDKGWN